MPLGRIHLFAALVAGLLCASPALAGPLSYNDAGSADTAPGAVQLCLNAAGKAVPVGSGCAGQAATITGVTPTDRTITSATGASQTVMSANANRHSLTIVNSGTANCGINPTGGTAALGGAGTLTLVPNGAYTPRIPSLSAITAICTAGQPLYADEN